MPDLRSARFYNARLSYIVLDFKLAGSCFKQGGVETFTKKLIRLTIDHWYQDSDQCL